MVKKNDKQQPRKVSLACKLTDAQKLQYSKGLAAAIAQRRSAEDNMKSHQTQLKAEIAGQEAQINLLSEKINSGHEYREVDCVFDYNWKAKVKSLVRLDTGETVREAPIDDAELQQHLDIDGRTEPEAGE